MRILISGGAGFIGSHLVDRLLSVGHTVLVVDNFATGRRDNLAAESMSLEVVEGHIGDLCVVNEAFERGRPEIVLHCTASYKDPEDWEEDVRTNVVGTINVVKAAMRVGVRRFVYFQTALCYGSHPREQPVTLGHPLNPENSYAISKTAGERYIALSGLDFISFRLANIIGPRNLSGPVPAFYDRLSRGQACVVVNTRRDFVYVEDLVEIVVRAIEGRGERGCYHVGSGGDYSIWELYQVVAAVMGVSRPPETRERASHDAPTISLDPAKTWRDFDWKAETPLAEGVQQAVAWYRRHGVAATYSHLQGARTGERA